MRIILGVITVLLALNSTKSQAQLKKVFESDSLKIYTNSDGENVKPAVCKLKFVSTFDDSVVVRFNNTLVFSKVLRADSTISTDVDLSAPYVTLPLKYKKAVLELSFSHEKFTVRSTVRPGYKYLYIYKQNKTVTLYYRNSKIRFY
jgi:hypothetical protein